MLHCIIPKQTVLLLTASFQTRNYCVHCIVPIQTVFCLWYHPKSVFCLWYHLKSVFCSQFHPRSDSILLTVSSQIWQYFAHSIIPVTVFYFAHSRAHSLTKNQCPLIRDEKHDCTILLGHQQRQKHVPQRQGTWLMQTVWFCLPQFASFSSASFGWSRLVAITSGCCPTWRRMLASTSPSAPCTNMTLLRRSRPQRPPEKKTSPHPRPARYQSPNPDPRPSPRKRSQVTGMTQEASRRNLKW